MNSDKSNSNYNKSKKPKVQKRRPGRDPVEVNEKIEASTMEENKSSSEKSFQEEKMDQSETLSHKKIKLEFFGSEIIKEKAPDAFEFVEAVADEWVNDGRFENIPMSHPFARAATAYGLRKAKNVEKKLEEKGVFLMAKIGIDYLQSKFKK